MLIAQRPINLTANAPERHNPTGCDLDRCVRDLPDTASLIEKIEDELCEDIDGNGGLYKVNDDQLEVEAQAGVEEQRYLKNHEEARIVSRKVFEKEQETEK